MRLPSLHLAATPTQGSALVVRLVVPAALLGFAVASWWWSLQMAGRKTSGVMDGMGMRGAMSFGSFVLAWVAMMAAMMLPAVLPVVRLYVRAATLGRAAPVPFFVAGYLGVWIAVALPGYLAWRVIELPLAEGASWVGRLAGGTLIAAALWQLTPLKAVCHTEFGTEHHCLAADRQGL